MIRMRSRGVCCTSCLALLMRFSVLERSVQKPPLPMDCTCHERKLHLHALAIKACYLTDDCLA